MHTSHALSTSETGNDDFLRETLPHLPELRSAARQLVGSREQAEDLVQETFALALAARDRYRLGSNARAWLYRILINAAHTERRRNRRDARLAERYSNETAARREPVLRADPVPGPASTAVEKALADLPPNYRTVVELVDLGELGYAEAAARLGVPVGTVMSRLHRGRALLRHALGSVAGLQPAPGTEAPRRVWTIQSRGH
ncbi:MAG TPA: RNA polymerase sigma factor [Polyangia bacterium]|jgi:RNA polymerase sigma-70 factor (ECF subfamily)|nr:RNA polymerase sigma factor [Polyangia bacterium]